MTGFQLDNPVFQRAHVRFEIAALYMMSQSVRRYFDMKFMRGVHW